MNTKRSSSGARGRVVLGLVLALVLPACGGSSGGGSVTGPAPTPAPTRNLVGTESLELGSLKQAQAVGLPFDATLVVFTISPAANPLEGIVQWSSPSNDVDLVLYRGECTVQAFYNQTCDEIADASSTTTKPEHLTVSNVAAGTYTFAVANFGPGKEDATLQIFATQ